jgi:hypothetical protein
MGQRGLAVGCAVWAVVGLLIASAGSGTVNDDARLLVFGATAVGVGAALLAAWLVLDGRPRWTGLCLVVSVVTPTWYAVIINLVPLVAGLILLSGRLNQGNRRGTEPRSSIPDVGDDQATAHVTRRSLGR